MNAVRIGPVVFCGENPNMMLVDSTTESITAAVSYWDCTYSDYGVGHVLLIYLDAKNVAVLDHARIAIYADNAPLARYLTDTFNQHFDDWQQWDFSGAAVEQARFSKESDSREFYRINCYSGQIQIDLLWNDIRDRGFRTFPDLNGGGFGSASDEHYHVANVIFLCGQGSITINQRHAAGTVHTRTLPDGRFSSSVFVALSETWIKSTEVTER